MWLFKRKGPSGFSYSSTAEDVTHGIDSSDLTAIVTVESVDDLSELFRCVKWYRS
ncbi:hypothetical protein QJS10_CPB18g01600 [Acorus calamus]|uniref:Uncharacterized protein n=1 Tax=Acorus calamus TaxID=4465 RepID=A0AAV9CPV4_ACOCL|nr:hypothetical protein QJS10_CPB18g01600 [Acorus calamus]